MKKTRNKQLLE